MASSSANSLFHQVPQSTDSILDRSLRVNAMLIVQVYSLYAEAAKTSMDSGANVAGLAADPRTIPNFVAMNTSWPLIQHRRDHHRSRSFPCSRAL